MGVAAVDFSVFDTSVSAALDAVGAREVLAGKSKVLIKPNLINASPPPITTPVECCKAIVSYIRGCSSAEIVIGEGCGDSAMETPEVFEFLGYTDMAESLGVPLVDLNHAPLVRLENSSRSVFPELYLPEIALNHYLISVPVLKAHSLAEITGTLKNMIGLAPPKHYSGQYGSWKKAIFHSRMQQSIIELNAYRSPDFTLMDASVGMPDFHLGGRHCDPPVGKLLAGFDPWEVDREAATLLGLNWRDIDHVARRMG